MEATWERGSQESGESGCEHKGKEGTTEAGMNMKALQRPTKFGGDLSRVGLRRCQ